MVLLRMAPLKSAVTKDREALVVISPFFHDYFWSIALDKVKDDVKELRFRGIVVPLCQVVRKDSPFGYLKFLLA